MMTEFFNRCVSYWKEFFNSAACPEFCRGYFSALESALAVLAALLVLYLLLRFCFRRRRVSEIVVTRSDGDVVLTSEAVFSVIRACALNFSGLTLDKIRIHRRGKRYSISIQCNFDGSQGMFPDVSNRMKKTMFDALKDTFGITSVRKIHLRLETFQATVIPQAVLPESEKVPEPFAKELPKLKMDAPGTEKTDE